MPYRFIREQFFNLCLRLICYAVLAISLTACAHYSAEEQARFRDTRCQWILWSADMPGREDCEYLLNQP